MDLGQPAGSVVLHLGRLRLLGHLSGGHSSRSALSLEQRDLRSKRVVNGRQRAG
jgi:hypothetical protein